MTTTTNIPGLNVQWPWSQLLLDGTKTVETRHYALPIKHVDRQLALIETPGPNGKCYAGIQRARIIGLIVFSESFQYLSYSDWSRDCSRHRVSTNDAAFLYGEKPKWGWLVASVTALAVPVEPPMPRGIVFASNCIVPLVPQ